jgi:zinc transporter
MPDAAGLLEADTGLIDGLLVDAEGNVPTVTEAALLETPRMRAPEGGYIWLHFDLERGRRWVPGSVIKDETIIRALFAAETRPRCDVHKGDILINLRGVNLNEGRQPEDMLSIRAHLREGRLITVRKQRSVAVEEVRARMHAGEADPGPGLLLLRIIRGLTDKMDPFVDGMSDSLDGLEARSMKEEAGDDLRSVVSALRHDAIVFRRYVAPQRDAIARFTANEAGLLPESMLPAAREEADRVTRIVEELDITRDRAGVVYDQIAAQRADQMNRNMMIISVVSAVFLPLAFLTGLLGINVGGMPGADSPAAFWIVCAICAGLGAALGYVFHRAGWLCGRRPL